MADVDTLKTIKTQTLALLADLTESPKPSYNIDGQQVSWMAYQKLLFDQLESLNKQIAAEEPFEIHTIGFT